MATERRSTTDGVTYERGAAPWRSRAWLAAALVLIVVAGWLAFTPRSAELRPDTRAPSSGGAASDAGPQRAARYAEPERRPERSPELESEGGPPPHGAAPQQLASETSGEASGGIALFPPPGTDPVKSGIVVPEDFPLPEGYLRHYQVTDDGQPMPAILMFHPDYELLDERGEPIPLPADRVVPPELAPDGLPIELLVPPEPRAEEGAP